MKTFVALVLLFSVICVQIEEAQTQPLVQEPNMTTDHFTAVCQDENSTVLTLQKGYIASAVQDCIPQQINPDPSNMTYKLDAKCLTGQSFIIEESHSTKITLSRTSYTLQCIDDNIDGYIADVTANVTEVKDKAPQAEKGHVSPQPHGSISMSVLGNTPSSLGSYDKFTTVPEIHLGDTIFLTIAHEQTTGKVYLIPQHCDARDTTDSLVLWNLTDSKLTKCFYEKDVMMGGFQAGEIKTKVDFAYAELKAFQFKAHPQKGITFSCNVRICSRIDKGQCRQDNDDFGKCGATNTGSGRRRRNVMDQDDSEVGQGSLHHVTTTLHIRDDVMSTGSASRAFHTVACFILPVLVMLVM